MRRPTEIRLQDYPKIFDRVFIDEAQDLAGYDLDLVELILRSSIQTNLVGDHRQATYSTNDGGKHKGYRGAQIINMFECWEKSGLCELEHHNHSYRCVQKICDFADIFHPVSKNTQSRNLVTTDHDGVFAIRKKDVGTYMKMFDIVPQVLRYSKATKNLPGRPMNFGQSKGMTFERTLIFPHGPFKKVLRSGNPEDAIKSLEKIYVAVTRAKQSVGIVIDDKYKGETIPVFIM